MANDASGESRVVEWIVGGDLKCLTREAGVSTL